MNSLKILNIALLALIITLAINIFTPKPEPALPQNVVSLSVKEKSVTIPYTPTIQVHNTTQQAINFHTCQDVTLTLNSAQNVNIADISPNFCQNLEIPANTTKDISFETLHSIFAGHPGTYSFVAKIGNDIKSIEFQVERAGFIKSFFTTLIYNPIYNLFAGIIIFLPNHSLGWAIVAITIIIRLILLYPQHRTLENARRMAELNPKIRALQKEYSNDRATLGMKMMELYKKENVSPMGSCLPLLIQFPILIGLYWVIMGITHPSNVYHLYSFLANFNPSLIDTFFFGHNLLQTGGTTAMILAVLLAGTQWLQGYISVQGQSTPPTVSEKKNDDNMPTFDPQIMQKMTLYVFPVLIGASALFFPIGLGLYWWIGLLFMIVQQLFVNARAKKIKQTGEIVKKSKKSS